MLSLSCLAQSGSGQQPTQQQGGQEAPPQAGGPQGDVGPIAIPKKPEEKPQEERPRPPKKIEGMPDYSISVNVPVVTVDASVITKDGMFIPNLKKENFRVYEDGVPQTLERAETGEAPITAVLLVEFAATNYYFMQDALNASYAFAQSMKKEDWVALIAYDIKPVILVDFTQNKNAIYEGLGQLRVPGFSETNLFDSIYDTIDRIEGIEGRKYIILVSSGIDTFSKIHYDQAMKKVQNSRDITIYAVGTGQALVNWLDLHRRLGTLARLDYLQAQNQLNTFAKLTGGRAFFPKFQAEFPEIFRDLGNTIRNQYSLSYRPTNRKQDGTFRKIKIELVDETGQPLKIVNEKGKQLKYQIVAREGYRARQEVE